MPKTNLAPTFPKLSVDKIHPGIIRIEGTDDMTGILAGMRAPEIVRRCNSHDALILAANSAKNYILHRGVDEDMAPVIEQLERAIAGKP